MDHLENDPNDFPSRLSIVRSKEQVLKKTRALKMTSRLWRLRNAKGLQKPEEEEDDKVSLLHGPIMVH